AGFYFSGALLAAAADLIPLSIEPWRGAFLLLSLAGLPLLALAALTADPARQARAAHGTPNDSLRLFLRQRWQAISLFVGTAGILMLGVQAINHLISLALERQFDAAPGQIGHAMGLIVLVTSMGCLPVAWALDHALATRLGQAVRPLLMGACALVAIPLALTLSTMGTLNHAFVAVGMTLFMTSTANAL